MLWFLIGNFADFTSRLVDDRRCVERSAELIIQALVLRVSNVAQEKKRDLRLRGRIGRERGGSSYRKR